MSEIDNLEAQFLESARHGLKLSAEHKDRHLTALLNTYALGATPSNAASEGAASEGAIHPSLGAPAASAPWVKAAAAKLVAWSAASALVGAALGFAAGYRMATQPSESREQSHAATTSAPTPLAPSAPPAAPISHAPEPAPSNMPQERVPPSMQHAEKFVAAHPTPAAPPPSKGEVESVSAVESLQEELAYLRRAQNALSSGDPQRALGLVRSLDEEMPSGRMLPEREVTRILSLCALGETNEAQARSRVFLEKYGKTLYADRVRRSCATATETPNTKH